MAKAKTTAEPKKTPCPISAETFEEKAKPMLLTLTGGNIPDGEKVCLAIGVSRHKDKDTGELIFGFSSGSFGWGVSDKVTIMVDGVPLKIQAGVNLVVVNSNPNAK